ncbi:HAD family hydrolase [Fimbriimonas ginsengisoli]|uniref:Putative hydrolase n=1 Tax=Fimbriimonas ginsengisoli Gsoil 348 TaxID=661478 RepID=A0A068NLA8_FIMGI|nr:HAD family hydrolase [Fimbriimonas ginsengisoli]AIE84358.1 putative hydrolase [Fimbriimonas ginsengisoli Gsoil 348]
MVRAVLFDLDGTLFDRDAALRRFAADQHRRLILQPVVDESEYVARFIELDDRGKVWKDRVYRQLVQEFPLSEPWEKLHADYETTFASHVSPYAGTEEMLRGLKGQNLALGIVSNGLTHFQKRTFKGLNLTALFDVLVISEAVGMRKPHPDIFHFALGQLGAEAANSVFVGDDPDADIVGSKLAGLRAVWLRSPEREEPAECDAIIDRITDLPNVLRGF